MPKKFWKFFPSVRRISNQNHDWIKSYDGKLLVTCLLTTLYSM